MALTHDEKLEWAKELPGHLSEDDFSKPPAATRGRESVAWEESLPLDIFRAHKGLGAAILTVFVDEMDNYDQKATDSIRNSIVGRLAKVHPSESWTTYVHDDHIFLKFNGEKVARKAKASE